MSDAYGSRQRPVALDISQLIRRVAWAGGATATITLEAELSFSSAAGEQPTQWAATITDSNVSALHGASLLDEIGPRVSPPGPPPSNIVRDNNAWSYPKEVTNDSETEVTDYVFIDRGLYEVYTSAGVITELVDPVFGPQVPFVQDSTGDHSPYGEYDVFAGSDLALGGSRDIRVINSAAQVFGIPPPEVAFPQLKQVISSHVDTVSRTTTTKTWKTITFLNFGRIRSSTAVVRDTNKIEFTVVFASVGSRVFIEWFLTVATWKGTKKFNLTDSNSAGVVPDPSKDPTDADEHESDRPPEQIAPSVEVKFTIDLITLQVTSTRRNLS